jgi:hypothetical protein
MGRLELFTTDHVLHKFTPHLAAGRDHSLEDQLIAKSYQPHILKNTPNDAGSRFTNRAALEKWFAQDRELFWLLGPTGDLAGIVWFGPKPLPLKIDLPEHPTETFGLRLYEGYLGKGLSAAFFLQGLALAAKRKQGRGQAVPAIWGVTDTDNAPARSVYARAGFRDIDHNEHRVHLVLSADHILKIANQFAPEPESKVGEAS